MKINLYKIICIFFFLFIAFSSLSWEKAALALESESLNADVPQESAKELKDSTPAESKKALKVTTPSESTKELKDTTPSETSKTLKDSTSSESLNDEGD
jgi:hypothetical protein